MDTAKIEKAIEMFLEAIGENPQREGLVETPKRVAKMYAELLEGIQYTNHDIAQKFNKTFSISSESAKDMVLVGDISTFSFCEHHIALMYDMKISIAYIPQDRVIGISKIARIADMVCKRLQLQEKISNDIYEVLHEILQTEDIAIHIEAKHSCMTARGIKNATAVTITNKFSGKFQQIDWQHEFLQSVK
jgi:GTP cyclohydrolase I